MNKLVMATLLVLLSISASAVEMGGRVKSLYVNPDGLVLFSLDADFSTTPSCKTNSGWQYAFHLSSTYSKEMYSTLLASYMADKIIKVGYGSGDSVCYASFPSVKPSYLYFSK